MQLTRNEIAVGPFGMTELQFYPVQNIDADCVEAAWIYVRAAKRGVAIVKCGVITLADAWLETSNAEAAEWLRNMVLVKLVEDDEQKTEPAGSRWISPRGRGVSI